MELKSTKHSFFYKKAYDGPLGQYLSSGYKIVEMTEDELKEYLEDVYGDMPKITHYSNGAVSIVTDKFSFSTGPLGAKLLDALVLEEAAKFLSQHSDGVVPDSNEKDLDIK